jgi:hypothetical protein
MQIGVSITLAFSVYKLRLSDDVPVQSDIVPLINIYFILCMFFSLSAMVWFSLKNIMIDKKRCPTNLKCFVSTILWHLMFLRYKYKRFEAKTDLKNNKKMFNSSKSMPSKFNRSKFSYGDDGERDAIYEDLNVYNQKPPTSIPLYEIDQHGRRSLISRDNSSDIESSYCTINNRNKRESYKKPLKSKFLKQNNEIKFNFEIEDEKTLLDDIEMIKVINQFVFVLYLIYFLALNLLCLYILPFYFKKSLSITD